MVVVRGGGSSWRRSQHEKTVRGSYLNFARFVKAKNYTLRFESFNGLRLQADYVHYVFAKLLEIVNRTDDSNNRRVITRIPEAAHKYRRIENSGDTHEEVVVQK